MDNGTLFPGVSVIIPVFGMRRELLVCLEAIEHNTYSQGPIEVVVVLNDSEPFPVCRKFRFNLRVFRLATPGSYAARNYGVLKASFDILAFTDADCIPSPGWIQFGVKRLVEGADRVAGDIILFSENLPRSLGYYFQELFGFQVLHDLRSRGQIATANLFVRKSSFLKVGNFAERAYSGGDVEWGQRANRAGLNSVFEPKASVFHPARETFADLAKHRKRIAGGLRNFPGGEGKRAWLEGLVGRLRLLASRLGPVFARHPVRAFGVLFFWLISVVIQVFWTVFYQLRPHAIPPRS